MSNHINLIRIKAVSNALEDIKREIVFVGGATVSLYADRDTLEVRPTDDVDILVEIATDGSMPIWKNNYEKRVFKIVIVEIL